MTMPSRIWAAVSVASIASSSTAKMSFQRITTIGSIPLEKSEATASREIRSPSFSSRWISIQYLSRSLNVGQVLQPLGELLAGGDQDLGQRHGLLHRRLDLVEAEEVGGLLGEVDDVVHLGRQPVDVLAVDRRDEGRVEAFDDVVGDPVALRARPRRSRSSGRRRRATVHHLVEQMGGMHACSARPRRRGRRRSDRGVGARSAPRAGILVATAESRRSAGAGRRAARPPGRRGARAAPPGRCAARLSGRTSGSTARRRRAPRSWRCRRSSAPARRASPPAAPRPRPAPPARPGCRGCAASGRRSPSAPGSPRRAGRCRRASARGSGRRSRPRGCSPRPRARPAAGSRSRAR